MKIAKDKDLKGLIDCFKLSFFNEKENERYENGLVVLYHVVNYEKDLQKASDVLFHLLLGYDVREMFTNEFEQGNKEINRDFNE